MCSVRLVSKVCVKIGRKHEEEVSDAHSMQLNMETPNGGPVACHDMCACMCMRFVSEVAEKLTKGLNTAGFTTLNGHNDMRTYQKKPNENSGSTAEAKKKPKQPRKPSKRKEPLNSKIINFKKKIFKK